MSRRKRKPRRISPVEPIHGHVAYDQNRYGTVVNFVSMLNEALDIYNGCKSKKIKYYGLTVKLDKKKGFWYLVVKPSHTFDAKVISIDPKYVTSFRLIVAMLRCNADVFVTNRRTVRWCKESKTFKTKWSLFKRYVYTTSVKEFYFNDVDNLIEALAYCKYDLVEQDKVMTYLYGNSWFEKLCNPIYIT